MAGKSTKLPTIYTYVSDEEKEAFTLLAKLEGRSFSNMLRKVVNTAVKEYGLLREEVNEEGEIVQTVVVPGSSKEGELLE